LKDNDSGLRNLSRDSAVKQRSLSCTPTKMFCFIPGSSVLLSGLIIMNPVCERRAITWHSNSARHHHYHSTITWKPD
ncbi:hypothetical protein AMELA_G00109230, partial [Ameiurus melas]